MANPTADWEKVGDKFYRKIQLYTAVFDQDLELENYIVTGCSYGGAIGTSLFHQSVEEGTEIRVGIPSGKGKRRGGDTLWKPTFPRRVLWPQFQSLFPLAIMRGSYRSNRSWNRGIMGEVAAKG